MRERLPKTTAVLRDGMERGLHLGAQLYASLRGERVGDIAVGESRPGVEMTSDTLALWMSMGKPVTAILIAKLVDAQKLEVNQPVADFIPEFAENGKEQITVAHLLTHSGGFRHVGSNWSGEAWEDVIGRISGAALEEEWVVGETAGYHTASSWFILAEIARRLFGHDDPREMYRREIFEPLGMPDCWVGMPRHKWMDYGTRVGYMFGTSRRRATGRPQQGETRAQSAEGSSDADAGLHSAASARYSKDSGTGMPSADPWHGDAPRALASANTEAGATLCRPGGNARGPMRELGRFYEQLLIDRGDLQSPRPRFLSAEVARMFTSRQLAGIYDKTFGTKLDWGFGFIINARGGRFPYNYGPHASADAFGHSGNQSTCAFADPKHGLVVCWATNGTPGELAHQRRQTAINKAVYEDLGLT